jgi:hypothetical protein
MHYLVIVIASLVMMASTARGQTTLTPDDVLRQYPMIDRGACTDNESGERGFCFVFQTGDGYYLVFTQNQAPVFMRHVVPPNPYRTIWRADTPLGMSL